VRGDEADCGRDWESAARGGENGLWGRRRRRRRRSRENESSGGSCVREKSESMSGQRERHPHEVGIAQDWAPIHSEGGRREAVRLAVGLSVCV
jgi:hypothetical protein